MRKQGHGFFRMISAAGVCLAAAVAPVHASIRIGIRDGYLKGLNAPSVWAAARQVFIPRLEVAVARDLTCPNLLEGKTAPYRVDTPAHRKELLAAARAHGCRIVAFCAAMRFTKESSDDEQADYVAKVAVAAADMKVPVVMVPFGAGGIEEAEFVRRATAFVKRMDEIAGRTGVQLTVENVGVFANKPEVLKPLMEAAPDDRVGLALDITNMYWFGHPLDRLYELAELFAPHVRYAHAKNIKYPPDVRNRRRTPGWKYREYAEPIRSGDIDFSRIIATLVRAGFDGDLVIEDDSLPKFDAAGQAKILMDDVSFLQEILVKQQPATQPASSSATRRPRVKIETSLGDFVVELYPDKAPETCENFLRYVDEGFYDGTIFHRIISHFMIQGGGFTAPGTPKRAGLHDPIRNEAKRGLKNRRGTIAMARTSEPHSATSQFFINVQDNANLDYPSFDGWGYCAFGQVVEGMDVVDRIKNVPTRTNPQMGGEKSEPIDPPIIRHIRRLD